MLATNLTLYSSGALFTSMLLLALIPSMSVLIVSTRTATSGVRHGLATAGGIVVGDLVYIVIALFGLTLLSGWMANYGYLIRYVGGAYLIYLGINLLRATSPHAQPEQVNATTSIYNSFLSGLFLTLADQKVILFYLGFFPAFINLSTITLLDTSLVMLIAIFAVGGAKVFYVILIDRTRSLLTSPKHIYLYKLGGAILITIGCLLLLAH